VEKITRLVIVALVAALLLAACSSDEPGPADETPPPPSRPGGAATGERASFVVITHGAAGDAFWDVVQNGAEAAARQYGVNVRYESDANAARQAQLIERAVDERVDGIVVSMANPDALAAAIAKAVDAGIPVITINSGVDRFKDVGALTHVGQSEDVAGGGAGEKLAEAGVSKLLCVVQEVGNVGLTQRCDGAAEGLGGTVERLQVDGTNPAAATRLIAARLQADTALDGVLTLNPAMAIAALDAIAASGSSARLATFDLSNGVANGIKEDRILFAVDQQQYLQGWLPITFLVLFKGNLSAAGGGLPVHTGPGFVTKENVQQVADFAAQGLR
jgi:simple sugar transport system substrate-binding protein